MSSDNEISALLRKIDQNQQEALEVQREHLELAKAQLERSNQSIQESLELQRAAVARQSRSTRMLLPIVWGLLALLLFLIIRWNIL